MGLSFPLSPRLDTKHHTCYAAKKRDLNSFLIRYGLAVLLIGLATLLSFRLPAMQDTPFMLFLGATVVAAVYGGFGPSVITLGGSFLVLSYLFVPEYYRFSFTRDIEETVRMLVFLLGSGICAALISGCRRSRAVQRENEERFQLLVDMASDAIIVLDHRCHILFANPATERMFGHTPDKLTGEPFATLLPHDDHRHTLEKLRKRLDTRKTILPADFLARHRDGHTLQVEITFGTLIHRGKQYYTAIIRDASARRSLAA